MSTRSADVETLLDEARAATGLDDFGPDAFRPGLAAYWDAVGREARLNALGEGAIRANVVGALANRLRVTDWLGQHPEIAGERIESPLVVIGMFRAGTTRLSTLLDADPANRSLLHWESRDSVPPPSPAELHAGPRVEAARAGAALLEQLNPRIPTVHHEEPDGPTECISVMSQDFKSLSWEAITNVPSYSEWLLGTDQHSAYAYHRRVLQLLQSAGARGRWTLKSPHHALALEALTDVHPGARLVLLHRDPVALCGSVCSLIQTLTATFSDADHTRYIARHWVAMLEEMVRRIEAFRASHPDVRVHDVAYGDLVRDPVGTVERIYGAFGEGLSPLARAAISAYAAAHPKGERGAHRYDVAQFGLDAGELRERFAGYVERYAVDTERTAEDGR